MAEYAAVVAALRWLRRAELPCALRIIIHCDCQAVLWRLTGRIRPMRRRGTVMLHRTALHLIMWLRSRGHEVVLRWVPRKRVKAADKLCRLAYSSAAARCPKALTQFLRYENPSPIPNRNELHAKLFTKVGRRADSELRTSPTQ